MQRSMPGKAGILKDRAPNCFRYAVKTRELKDANAEADFFFIWGIPGFLACLVTRRIVLRTGHFLLRDRSLREDEQNCQDFS